MRGAVFKTVVGAREAHPGGFDSHALPPTYPHHAYGCVRTLPAWQTLGAMAGIKLAYIGGGSTRAPGTVASFIARAEGFAVATILLVLTAVVLAAVDARVRGGDA